MTTKIPWPPVPSCDCGYGPARVMLRDRLGAELECDACHRVIVVWFTPEETATIESALSR